MKKKLLILIFSLTFLIISADDHKNKLIASWEDLNKSYAIKLEVQNNQVLFAKPLSTITLEFSSKTKIIEVLEQSKPYSFSVKAKKIEIKLPDENKQIEVKIQFKNNEKITFTIITAIIDKDTEDGEIKFGGETYVIGNYPAIPKLGKTNYFKEKYAHPKYFFIWNSLLEDRPISINMKYSDLVIKPDAEKPELPRPPRATKVFTLSYETIFNFDTILEKARLKTPFLKATILSYYRTPEYNRSIGGSNFSRHIYGDGIDWFVDENPENDEMDDLNKDGKVTQEDALPFVQTIIELVTKRNIEPCGTGVYFTKKGASLHYDSRGHLARWGASDLWWPDKDLPDWLQEIEKKVKESDEQKKKD